MANSLQCHTGITQLDLVENEYQMAEAAANGTPVLEELVWAPAWMSAYFHDRAQFEETEGFFECDIVRTLAPVHLYVCVARNTAMRSWSDKRRRVFWSNCAATVDEDEWRRVEEPGALSGGGVEEP